MVVIKRFRNRLKVQRDKSYIAVKRNGKNAVNGVDILIRTMHQTKYVDQPMPDQTSSVVAQYAKRGKSDSTKSPKKSEHDRGHNELWGI